MDYEMRMRLTWTKVRAVCVQRDYYTCGTNEDYDAMFHKVDKFNETQDKQVLFDIAQDIFDHSDTPDSVLDILNGIAFEIKVSFN